MKTSGTTHNSIGKTPVAAGCEVSEPSGEPVEIICAPWPARGGGGGRFHHKTKGNTMKTTSTLLAALALGATVWTSAAQDQKRPERPPGEPREGRPADGPPGEFRRGQGGPGGPGNPGGGERMRPPVMAALDANNDGVVDESEIANAAAALKKLDKNGDGKLTMDEMMPPRPQGDRGPGAPGGPGGPGVGGENRRRPDGQGGPGAGPEGRRPGGDEPQKRERPKSE